jgi:hypothetical protein
MTSPRRFQFHLSTALLGMIAIGLVMPKIISAFRLSKTDGAAVVYTMTIPFVLGALEFEAFLARREAAADEKDSDGSKPLPLKIPFPVLAFVLELVLVGLWALTAARTLFIFAGRSPG